MPQSNFFSKLNIIQKIETDHGTACECGAQLHLRFPLYFFIYEIATKFPELDVKAQPYTSLFSLVPYCQFLLNTSLVVNDLYVRGVKSYCASLYRSDPYRRDYLNIILGLKVPPFVELLINQLPATYDPQRFLLAFVPSLAGYSFEYDLGRSVTPALMMLAHEILTSVRTNENPVVILCKFYASMLTRVANSNLCVTHFLEAQYLQGNTAIIHPNWLNESTKKPHR